MGTLRAPPVAAGQTCVCRPVLVRFSVILAESIENNIELGKVNLVLYDGLNIVHESILKRNFNLELGKSQASISTG